MLVATFGPTTTWVGKTVTYSDGAFVLEGHGPIRAQDVFEYERQGHLVWAMDGVRAWVGAKAQAEGGDGPSPSHTGGWQTEEKGSVVQLEAATPAQAEPAAAIAVADLVRERALRSALAAGFSRDEFEAEERVRVDAGGDHASPGDAFLSLAGRAIDDGRTTHDWPRLSVLYSLQAWWLDEAGRDSLAAVRRARQAELYALDAEGVERVRIVVADGDACSTCDGNGGREMRVADALRRMVVPNPSCGHGWCRCHWEPVTK
jgi:hypothetical protein